ncbi:uncharacterized protein LOC121479395 [Vulpes lagopus]|uniref:uncharacterized protein LOC121479395 n=1 Tax=Vulpes lagopus TaxID=494514 RepID=UPI001BC8E69F|nr:uncharacterized protein LOC121479395 [Vulpes lagopus]XP_041590862.1 uncharacterized protein LOC121479395 [Vulpes lagopus]
MGPGVLGPGGQREGSTWDPSCTQAHLGQRDRLAHGTLGRCLCLVCGRGPSGPKSDSWGRRWPWGPGWADQVLVTSRGCPEGHTAGPPTDRPVLPLKRVCVHGHTVPRLSVHAQGCTHRGQASGIPLKLPASLAAPRCAQRDCRGSSSRGNAAGRGGCVEPPLSCRSAVCPVGLRPPHPRAPGPGGPAVVGALTWAGCYVAPAHLGRWPCWPLCSGRAWDTRGLLKGEQGRAGHSPGSLSPGPVPCPSQQRQPRWDPSRHWGHGPRGGPHSGAAWGQPSCRAPGLGALRAPGSGPARTTVLTSA